MIIGIGVDIEDISRFRNLPYEKNKLFYGRIFTLNEINYCLNKSNPSQHFAVRFCAKEAFMKAMLKEVKDYKKIEVKFNEEKPYIEWPELKVKLSLAHEKDKAIAFVIVEEK